MRVQLVARDELVVGQPIVVKGDSPVQKLSAVFKDDGDTGYFYALDLGMAGNPIVDALAVYIVTSVTDRAIPSKVQTAWSMDGMKVILLINDFPHGIFDFVEHRGYCRTGFPPPNGKWTNLGHEWSDDALRLFE